MNSALKPLKPYAADLSILSNESSVMLPYDLKQQISCLSSVKKVYGRMFYDNISAQYQNYDNMAMLISYDEPQFLWADDMLIEGNIDNVQYGNGVIVDYGYAQQFHWKVGDVITLNVNKTTQNVIISALISDVPFEAENGEWILVCSENTFTKLTDISEYTIIDMQVSQNISEQIRNLITGDMKLLDKQQSNQEIRRSYFAMAVFVYGFLSVIALVAFINIVNTVNTSISSKKNQYGVMRAVGMSCKQIKNMIKVEALTYAATGSIFGTVFGLLLHHLLFEMLITPRWGQIWQPPIFITTLLVFTAMITTLFAAILYSQKIEKTSIVNMISAS
jgi:putative ABC transport system permease protein